jgi:hypothetical protein
MKRGTKTKSYSLAPEKARESILLLCQYLKNAPGFGNVVLEKALFRADQKSYFRTKKPITGFTYVRQQHGPTADPAQFLPLTKQMEKEGLLRWERLKADQRNQDRPIALEPTGNGPFALSLEEVECLKEAARDFLNDTATSASKASHGLAWQIARHREEIPLFTALVSESPVRESDFEWARGVISEIEGK